MLRKAVGEYVGGLLAARKFLALACVALVALVCTSVAQAEAVTLPSTGVDVAGHVTALITALGAVVAVVVGGFFAYLLIRMGMGWGRSAKG